MNHHFNPLIRLGAFALFALFIATPATADKPSRGEDRHENKHEKKSEERQKNNPKKEGHESGKAHFDDTNRNVIHDYYGTKFRTGKCPPGLARKNNGCLPPGQAKKWSIGQPLPADLKRYNLPKELLVKLPPPPSEHRYVRVASDILLIAVGTSMIVDAIEDIGR